MREWAALIQREPISDTCFPISKKVLSKVNTVHKAVENWSNERYVNALGSV